MTLPLQSRVAVKSHEIWYIKILLPFTVLTTECVMLLQQNYLLSLIVSRGACSKSLQSSSCETMNSVTCVELFWLGSTASVATESLPSSLRGMSSSALRASKKALHTLGASSLICAHADVRLKHEQKQNRDWYKWRQYGMIGGRFGVIWYRVD